MSDTVRLLSEDSRGQFGAIVAMGGMISVVTLRVIAHEAGTPTAIAVATLAGIAWTVVKRDLYGVWR